MNQATRSRTARSIPCGILVNSLAKDRNHSAIQTIDIDSRPTGNRDYLYYQPESG